MMWMFKALWRTVRLRVIIPLLAIVGAVNCWTLVRPEPFPVDQRRLALAEEVAGKLAESLPVPPAGRPTIVVAPFERDSTGVATEAVRRAIERVDRYAVQPSSLWEKVSRRFGLQAETVAPEAAEKLALESIPGEYLLAGRVQMLSARTDADEAVLEGTLIPVAMPVANVASSKKFAIQTRDEPTTSVTPGYPVRLVAHARHAHSGEAGEAGLGRYPWPTRLVVWLLGVLLLPLALSPLVVRGLEQQSNAVNLLMLLGLTALAGLGAFAMIGFRLDTAWAAMLVVAAVAMALAYNWSVLSKLDELRE